MTPPVHSESPIAATPGMGGLGRIKPGTALAVREATDEERAAQEKRIRECDPEPEWLGHRWLVVFAGDPSQVLHDWFAPVGGHDREAAVDQARKYARARGAEVVELDDGA